MKRVLCAYVQSRSPHEPHAGWSVYCPGYPIQQAKPKVSVRWEEAPQGGSYKPVMWVGRCSGCDYTTQYWAWGATLGRMFEHQWKGCKK